MPSVLVLGGVGFIGRNFVVYLVENNLADKIRVSDKALPQTSYLTPRQQAAFEKVEFVQANLARDASVAKAFDNGGQPWDLVVNCAGMTKFGQEEIVYQENIYDVTVKCAAEAAKQGAKRFIEVSTAQVYAADKKPSPETAKVDPWTALARMKLKAEQELAKIDGLNYIIVRPATVYGTSDMLGLMPRIICAAVYKKLGDKMKFLWTEKLRLNTVHVDDVAKALWHLRDKGSNGEIFNLADSADSSQGSINEILSQLFGIQTGFHGTMVSNLAKLAMNSAVEESNEKHMQPWSDMCREAGIANTPLSPYLDKELLYNNSLAVDGSKITGTGFEYEHPAPRTEDLRAVVQQYIDQQLFPAGYLV